MNKETALFLNDLNARFYATVHQSFSETRANAWPGWVRLLETIGELPSLSVLDVACGNLRFEKFLRSSLDGELSLYAIDNCQELVPAEVGVSFSEYDVVSALMAEESGPVDLLHPFNREVSEVDLAVAFGFLHHIPGFESRTRFLESLLSCVRPGGYVAVSLWRFRASEKLAKKSDASTMDAIKYFETEYGNEFSAKLVEELDVNDCFLGWQERCDAFRYCHHFDDEEVAMLTQELSADAGLVASYLADGKTGDLNRYLIFRKH